MNQTRYPLDLNPHWEAQSAAVFKFGPVILDADLAQLLLQGCQAGGGCVLGPRGLGSCPEAPPAARGLQPQRSMACGEGLLTGLSPHLE